MSIPFDIVWNALDLRVICARYTQHCHTLSVTLLWSTHTQFILNTIQFNAFQVDEINWLKMTTTKAIALSLSFSMFWNLNRMYLCLCTIYRFEIVLFVFLSMCVCVYSCVRMLFISSFQKWLYLKAILMMYRWNCVSVASDVAPNKNVTRLADAFDLFAPSLSRHFDFRWGISMHTHLLWNSGINRIDCRIEISFLSFSENKTKERNTPEKKMKKQKERINKARDHWTVNSNQFHNNMSKYKRRPIVRIVQTILCQRARSYELRQHFGGKMFRPNERLAGNRVVFREQTRFSKSIPYHRSSHTVLFTPFSTHTIDLCKWQNKIRTRWKKERFV